MSFANLQTGGVWVLIKAEMRRFSCLCALTLVWVKRFYGGRNWSPMTRLHQKFTTEIPVG